MAARLNRKHQEFVRDKIRATQLVNRLENHAFGEVDLTPTQIKAIEILLRKCVPDLSAVTHSGSVEHKHARQMSDDELAHIASGSGSGTVDAQESAADAPSLH